MSIRIKPSGVAYVPPTRNEEAIAARVAGRDVYIDTQGREVSASEATPQALADQTVRQRTNGPHHDAKWARHLLGTPTQAEYRRSRAVARAQMLTGTPPVANLVNINT